MNEEDLKKFKHLLSTGISTGMDIMLDYKFQKELLKKIKYYEKIERENQQLKDRINNAIEYVEKCNPDVDLHNMFLNENYISNYGACELLKVLRGKDD